MVAIVSCSLDWVALISLNSCVINAMMGFLFVAPGAASSLAISFWEKWGLYWDIA